MNDFDKLRENRDFAGSLLRSALDDAPAPGARLRAAVAVGLLAPGAGALSSVVSATALSAGTQPTASIGCALVAKWFLSSFVVAALGSSSAIVASEVVLGSDAEPAARATLASTERMPPAPPASVRRPNGVGQPGVPPPASTAGARIEGTRTESASTWSSVSASAHQAPRAPSTQAREGAATPAPRLPSVADEIAWLDPATHALKAGDGARALALLQQAEPRVHFLAREVQVLRVEALLLAGRRLEAKQVARGVLDRDPNGVYAQRVQNLLQASSSKVESSPSPERSP